VTEASQPRRAGLVAVSLIPIRLVNFHGDAPADLVLTTGVSVPSPPPRTRVRLLVATGLVAVLATVAACGGSGSSSGGSGSGGGSKVKVRLGYFPNITHATAIVGVDKGFFEKALGASGTLDPKTFADGTAASEAILSNSIDMSYVGPNPAINSFQKTQGKAVRVISGATSGGAQLIVKASISKPGDLKGKTLATPKLGNTQDVALRSYLKDQGLKTDTSGGGDVAIQPHDNADTLQLFKSGDIDGAWVPEPWATRLTVEGKGKALVDEKSLWPGGKFVTTVLMVRTDFLGAHPDIVKKVLQGQIDSNTWVNANTEEAKKVVNAGIEKITTKKLAPEVVNQAWANLEFTDDPLVSSFKKDATNAKAVGLLDETSLEGLFDLKPLNQLLKADGKPEVKDT